MGSEDILRKGDYTTRAQILVSRNDGDPVPVTLEDGKVIQGDSENPDGFSQVELDSGGGDEGGSTAAVEVVMFTATYDDLDAGFDASAYFQFSGEGSEDTVFTVSDATPTPDWITLSNDPDGNIQLTPGIYLVTGFLYVGTLSNVRVSVDYGGRGVGVNSLAVDFPFPTGLAVSTIELGQLIVVTEELPALQLTAFRSGGTWASVTGISANLSIARLAATGDGYGS